MSPKKELNDILMSQAADKIIELQEKIERLQAERERLKKVLTELVLTADPKTNLSMIPLLDALALARGELEDDTAG